MSTGFPRLTAANAAEWFAKVAREDRAIGAFMTLLAPPTAIGTGALSGLPVAIKDNIDVAGVPTGAGLGGAATPALGDAPAVALLRAAGAVILGKTRMDEAALGAGGVNPHWGRIENPRASGRSAGGSSGGSAAAVAAGFCAAALGSDTLGSVRIPAAYCGVVGLKPTRGRLSLTGVVPLSPSFDHIGILAGDVATAALVLKVLSPRSVPSHAALGLVAIGLPSALASCRIAPAVAAALAAAGARLRAAGHRVTEIAIADWVPDRLRRAAFLVIEVEGAAVYREPLAAESPTLSPRLRRLLQYGRDCPPEKQAAARRAVAAVAAGLDAAFERVDFLLLPTVPDTAFRGDAAPADQADFTALANIAGLPAISVPAGCDAEGAPIGLQLIGRADAEDRLLALAREIEAAGRDG